jgi:hypothetical protein
MRLEVQRVWPSTLENLFTKISLSGHVVDAVTKKPIRAYFKLEGQNFLNDEKRFSNEKRKGRFHLWIPNGSWKIEINADGYKTKHVELMLNREGTVMDFEMEKP